MLPLILVALLAVAGAAVPAGAAAVPADGTAVKREHIRAWFAQHMAAHADAPAAGAPAAGAPARAPEADTPAAGEAPVLADVTNSPEYQWFAQHVSTRCFAAPDAVWQLDDGGKETVLSRVTEYFGITAQSESFHHYYSTTTRQAEFAVSANGTRTPVGEVQRNVVVYRCQYGVRRSTRAVHGICYPSNAEGTPMARTEQPWPFTVYVASMQLLANGSLAVSHATAGPYEDLHAATDTGTKPGRQEAQLLYRAEAASGRVTLQTQISVFDVDPATLAKTFVGTQQPVVEAEVPCSTRR